MTLYTVGHSTRSAEELLALLRDAGIEVLVDVRSFPRSRTNPQFNIETLPDTLKPAGIAYRHVRDLGGRRNKQDLGYPSPNGFWRNASFRNYADYALTPAFRSALAALVALAEEKTCAVMCAEAAWQRCHRQIITDHLLGLGHEVVHIVAENRMEPAQINAGAELQADGVVHYPAAQGELL